MKKYYIADSEHSDKIYGNQAPICIDFNEVRRLAYEWDMTTQELLEQMHEASAAEIEEFGVYNSAKTERLQIRISPELKIQLKRQADAEGRTISNYIEQLIKKAIQNQ